MAKTPDWYKYAESLVGIREIKGPKHNGIIVGWLEKLGAWWREDSTPWCGAFTGHVMQRCNLPYPREWYRAKSWSTYGSRLLPSRLAVGAILVFDRKGGGHVGFYAGEDATAYYVLGGNQSDSVRFSWIDKSRLTASRWPKGEPVIGGRVIRKRDGSLSTNEA